MQHDPTGDFVATNRTGTKTVSTLGKFRNIGQESAISAGDRTLINRVYDNKCGHQRQ